VNAAQQDVINRIAKLLRLSRGTDHAAEAAAALAKAAAIAQAAGLVLDGIDADVTAPRIVHEDGGAKRRSHSRMRCHGVLRRHFGVDVIGSSWSGSIYIGPAINIALARHIETYLVRQCAAGWVAFSVPTKRRSKAGVKRAYKCGFYSGIEEVLQAHPIRNDNPELAAAIEKYEGENFRVKSAPIARPDKRHQAAVFSGFIDGNATPCSRPVDGAEGGAMALPASGRMRLTGGAE
jgi:hypothetical protein